MREGPMVEPPSQDPSNLATSPKPAKPSTNQIGTLQIDLKAPNDTANADKNLGRN